MRGSIKGKVLIFPFHKGSSGWENKFMENYRKGNGPLAIINRELDYMVVTAATVTDTPMVAELNIDPCYVIETGDWVKVDADHGVIEVYKMKHQE